jgi:hypothetical protein
LLIRKDLQLWRRPFTLVGVNTKGKNGTSLSLPFPQLPGAHTPANIVASSACW